MKVILVSILVSILIFPVILFSQINNPVVFTADDTDSLITAEFEFSTLPEYADSSIVKITLKAINSRLSEHALEKPNRIKRIPGVHLKDLGPEELKISKVLNLNLVAGPSRYTGFFDSVVAWNPPINAGDSMVISIPLQFKGVGEYNIVISEVSGIKDAVNLRVSMVIGEDGKLVYLGKAPAPFGNPLGVHPYVFGKVIRDVLAGQTDSSRHVGIALSEPYDIKLTIDSNLQVGKTSIANLSIEPMSDSIEQLQYEIIAAHNLKIDSLSPSPGRNPGIGNKFDVSFQITPTKPGRSYLAFEIFGYDPDARHSDIISSALRYYLVFGTDSALLYMGSIDPFAAEINTDNPAYKKIKGIMDFADTGYGEKVYRSEPDFEYDRINDRRIQDSITSSKLIDTIPAKDSGR